MVAFNLSGIPVLNVFTVDIFSIVTDKHLIHSYSTDFQTTAIGVSNFIGAVVSNFTVFKFGRRAVFIVGMTIVGVCMIVIAVLVSHG